MTGPIAKVLCYKAARQKLPARVTKNVSAKCASKVLTPYDHGSSKHTKTKSGELKHHTPDTPRLCSQCFAFDLHGFQLHSCLTKETLLKRSFGIAFGIAFGISWHSDIADDCCGVETPCSQHYQTTWWEESQYGVIPSIERSSNLTNSWGLHLGHWAICLKHFTGFPVVQTMWRERQHFWCGSSIPNLFLRCWQYMANVWQWW